jgi:LysM repeat protein
MKIFKCVATLLILFIGTTAAMAKNAEPTVYVVKKGDTLWGLSDRFIKDPYYWPDLWARNPDNITNPHFIFPGQRLKIYPDRIEVVPQEKAPEMAAEVPAVSKAPAPEPQPQPQEVEEPVVQERTYTVNGGEGFIAGERFKPYGFVIAGHHNRQILAEEDIVYTDIGSDNGGRVGDSFTILKNYGAVSHPLTNEILGFRTAPLGVLQLTEMEEKASKALITSSFMEIEPGAALLPYKSMRREVALKAADRDLTGYIVETRAGNQAIATGDIAYIDLGEKHGARIGNLLYVVRKPEAELRYFSSSDLKLPVDVLGAVLIVDTAESTSTVLVIKSIDTIYTGDRLEMKKGR